MSHLGQILKYLREIHCYKQQWVAQKLGLSEEGLRKIETGKTKNVKQGYLKKAAELYKISLPDLLQTPVPPTIMQPQLNEDVELNAELVGAQYQPTPDGDLQVTIVLKINRYSGNQEASIAITAMRQLPGTDLA